jgi:hypothetical protein
MQIYSEITKKNHYIDDENVMMVLLMVRAVEKANRRFREQHYDFELIELVKSACIVAGLDVRNKADEFSIISGYCGFTIETACGYISIIVNDCSRLELVPYFNNGEHRRFIKGPSAKNANDDGDGENYNPWFTEDDSWLEEIKRVNTIMNGPREKLTKTQRRRLRRKSHNLKKKSSY